VLGLTNQGLPGGAYGGERETVAGVMFSDGRFPQSGAVAQNAYLSIVVERYNELPVIEISQKPSKVLPQESDYPDPEEVQAWDEEVSRRLYSLQAPAALSDLLPAEEGWVIEPEAQDLLVDRGPWTSYERTQHTIGFPVDGLPQVLSALAADGRANMLSGRWTLEQGHIHRIQALENLVRGMHLGRTVTERFAPGPLSGQELETVASYLALVFTHFAALNGTSSGLLLAKDFTLLVMRQDLRHVYEALTPAQQSYLERAAGQIRSMFETSLRAAHASAVERLAEFLRVGPPIPAQERDDEMSDDGVGGEIEVQWSDMALERQLGAGLDTLLTAHPARMWSHLSSSPHNAIFELAFDVHTTLDGLDTHGGALPLGLLVAEFRAWGNSHPDAFAEYVRDSRRAQDLARAAWNRAVRVRGLDPALLVPLLWIRDPSADDPSAGPSADDVPGTVASDGPSATGS